jgi:hypothetical protein
MVSYDIIKLIDSHSLIITLDNQIVIIVVDNSQLLNSPVVGLNTYSFISKEPYLCIMS